MPRSVRLYTPAQFEEVKTLVDRWPNNPACRPPNATGSPRSRRTCSRRSARTAAAPLAPPACPWQRADRA